MSLGLSIENWVICLWCVYHWNIYQCISSSGVSMFDAHCQQAMVVDSQLRLLKGWWQKSFWQGRRVFVLIEGRGWLKRAKCESGKKWMLSSRLMHDLFSTSSPSLMSSLSSMLLWCRCRPPMSLHSTPNLEFKWLCCDVIAWYYSSAGSRLQLSQKSCSSSIYCAIWSTIQVRIDKYLGNICDTFNVILHAWFVKTYWFKSWWQCFRKCLLCEEEVRVRVWEGGQ